MKLLVGARIEVNILSAEEDEDGEGSWYVGKVKSVTRTRGVCVQYNNGEPDEWFEDICAATEGQRWRIAV